MREDDPNDRVPYQLRRETRGAYAIFSWLDHTDMKEDNTLDMYVEDPADKKVHYVVHYLVDFGKALGMQALTGRFKPQGRAYALDLRDSAISLVSLGLWKRPWEDRRWPDHIRGVGMFDSRTYDPAKWKANSPQYRPVPRGRPVRQLLGREDPRPLHPRPAARGGRAGPLQRSACGRLHHPGAGRAPAQDGAPLVRPGGSARPVRRRVGRRRTPLLRGPVLRHRLVGSAPSETRYRARAFDGDGRPLPWRVVATGTRNGRVCLPRLAPPAGADQYTIIRIETSRPGQNLPGVLVHIARDPRQGHLRVIGIRRL